MTQSAIARKQIIYYTPTSSLMNRLLVEHNPVTQSVISDIIGHRIDAATDAAAQAALLAKDIEKRLEQLSTMPLPEPPK